MFAKNFLKTIAPLLVAASILSACQAHKTEDAPTLGVNGEKIDITGGIIDLSGTPQAQSTHIVPSDPNVQVYPLDGTVQNPLSVERYNSVLDNTTAGGYTVFDDSVKVYPLPGVEVPAYVPVYAVPPLEGQYKPEAPRVGTPTSLAESTLPPVPTVEVGEAKPFANPPISGAVRQPLTLTNPEPAGMQAPSSARAPMLSPFADERADVVPAEASQEHPTASPRGPMLTDADPAPMDGGDLPTTEAAPALATAITPQNGVTAPGRKSGPSLTGY